MKEGRYTWGQFFIYVSNLVEDCEDIDLISKLTYLTDEGKFDDTTPFEVIYTQVNKTHEMTHLMQDFFNGACADLDFIKRELSWHILSIIRDISDSKTVEFNYESDDVKMHPLYPELMKWKDLYDKFWREKKVIDFMNYNYSVSSSDLIESLAKIKTIALMEKRLSGISKENLSTIKSDLDDVLYNIYGENSPFDVFHRLFSKSSFTTDLLYKAFLTVGVASCHTLPLAYHRTVTQESSFNDGYFSPIDRFFKILRLLVDNKGFPDAEVDTNGKVTEDFVKTFYNWVAKQLEWPSFDEVCGERDRILNEMFENHRLISYRYKQFAINELFRYPEISVGYADCFSVLAKMEIPVLIADQNHMHIYHNLCGLRYLTPLGEFSVSWLEGLSCLPDGFEFDVPEGINGDERLKAYAEKNFEIQRHFMREALHHVLEDNLTKIFFKEPTECFGRDINFYCKHKCAVSDKKFDRNMNCLVFNFLLGHRIRVENLKF